MYSTALDISHRLAPVLPAGWDVACGSVPQSRIKLPRADVRVADPTVGETRFDRIPTREAYIVTLAADMGTQATAAATLAALDAARQAALNALHGWCPPGQVTRLTLIAMRSLDEPMTTTAGWELAFELKHVLTVTPPTTGPDPTPTP